MADQKRPYRMKRRAELEGETRRRITESAVELHGTLGPARTSVSAIADHAGVRRSTVYRHFPDEEALFVACTGHWRASNPPPDLEAWAAIEDPGERLRHALDELYAYYRSTHGMLANVLRDEALSPLVARMLAGYYDYIAAARETLMARRLARGASRRRTEAAIGHALAFATWRSLTLEEGLDDSQAAELICRFVAAAAPRVASHAARGR
jgi:AcrR family transcriptional regulator